MVGTVKQLKTGGAPSTPSILVVLHSTSFNFLSKQLLHVGPERIRDPSL